MEGLNDVWLSAVGDLCSTGVGGCWWSIICNKYNAPNRRFHNSSYLVKLFQYYNEYQNKLKTPNAVTLAIFFHKLEYDAQSSDGESKSIEEFNKFIEECNEGAKDSATVSETRRLLDACRSNLTEVHMTEGATGTDDEHYLLDMTMALLGSSADEYQEYTVNIQAEYGHLTAAAYSQLRLKILQSLLTIPNVYATAEFQERFEKQARANIAAEIERLKEGAP